MIALDAMGGDFAPTVTIEAAINAAKSGIPVALYGDRAIIEPILNRSKLSLKTLPLFLFHCSQIIHMDEEPSRAVLKKKDASLVRAVQAVADGQASAVVSAGNSGAALVAGTLILKRADGVLRPAFGASLPTQTSTIFCLDLGANVDCKPEYLAQFALMGHVYARIVNGVANPRIALLSNGAESCKGPVVVQKAHDLLSAMDIEFIGNLEARDIFDDRADVLVCDGFSGNILLKSVQGTVKAMGGWIKAEASRNLLRKFLFMLNGKIFKDLKARTDYTRKGGALLLGVQHPLIIAHGCSQAPALEQAIRYAHALVQEKFVLRYNQELTALIQHAAVPIMPKNAYAARELF